MSNGTTGGTPEPSRQDQFSGTKDVAESHRFDEKRLEAYMQAHVEGFKGPLTVQQFKGGQSNPTYKLVTPDRAYVLRRKPPGKLLPSAHAADCEYKVITALHNVGFAATRTRSAEHQSELQPLKSTSY